MLVELLEQEENSEQLEIDSAESPKTKIRFLVLNHRNCTVSALIVEYV